MTKSQLILEEIEIYIYTPQKPLRSSNSDYDRGYNAGRKQIIMDLKEIIKEYDPDFKSRLKVLKEI